MNRRDTLLALLALAGAPFAVRAQPAPRAKPFRIGLLPGGSSNDWQEFMRSWVAGEMGKIGWVEGRDFILVSSRLDYSFEHFEEDVRRVVAAKPDLIITSTDGYVDSVQKLTTAIPIVVWASLDPVAAGFANSLARPGKNVAGIAYTAGTGVLGKLVEVLHDAKPSIKRIGVLWDWVPPFISRKEAEPYLQAIKHAARVYGKTLHIAEVSPSARMSDALAQIEAARPDALISTSGPGIGGGNGGQRVTQFAVDKRLPLIVDLAWFPVDPYPMLSYGPSGSELMHTAVSYVNRILGKGEKPGDLPFQQVSKFELIVNLKSAKAIGFTIPQLLLLRADKVID